MSDDTKCHLCGLPLRFGAVEHDALLFCCHGCQMVFTMLLEATDSADPAQFQQTDLYRQCVAAGIIPASEADMERMHQQPHAADPAQAAEPVSQCRTALTADFTIDGMWCMACAWVIEAVVTQLEGILSANCLFSTDRMRCHYDPARIAPDEIQAAIARLGYRAFPAGASDPDRTANKREWIRLAITALLSANVMMLSWALYSGFFTVLSEHAIGSISLPIVAMATVVFFYGGRPLWRKAWQGLIHGVSGMETLVGMAAASAFGFSIYHWLSGSIHLYFDTACMLITLVLLGKMMERHARRRVRQDLEHFFSLQPNKVRILTPETPAGRYVSITQLTPGDLFAAATDEIIAADGRIRRGRALVDMSLLTGEAQPVSVKPGDAVTAGARLVSGHLTISAQQVGDAAMLGRMIAIIQQSLEQKTSAESRADQLLKWFSPAILLIAIATGILSVMAGLGANQAVIRAVTVMVIACPCALGIAIPMARMAGMAVAGRNGILVRDVEAFTQFDHIDTLVFDKTGTLTCGHWQPADIICTPPYQPDQILSLAAGLEKESDHLIAHAITADARRRRIQPADISQTKIDARGMCGAHQGRQLRIGNWQFACPNAVAPAQPPHTNNLYSYIYLSIDGKLAATLVMGDSLRPGMLELVGKLKQAGYRLHIVSGDSASATRQTATLLGIDAAFGAMTPTGKADYIGKLKRQGRHVAMIGDGINDAPAMARADLAAAVHAGQALAGEAADITLMRGDPAQWLDFAPLAKRVNQKVMQNLWCAGIYNALSIPIAVSGLLTPLIAATAMLLSSLTVTINTLVLVRKKDAGNADCE